MIPKKQTKRTAATLIAAVLTSSALTGTAFGQHELSDGQFVIHPDSIEAMELLSRRNRETIHPGDPLQVVGLGQADNNFREGLHAAKRGSYVPVQVDDKEIYARQLAMYDSSQSFDAPLRVLESPGGVVTERAPQATKEAAPEDKPYDTAWIGMLLAAMASVGAFLTRGRGAPVT